MPPDNQFALPILASPRYNVGMVHDEVYITVQLAKVMFCSLNSSFAVHWVNSSSSVSRAGEILSPSQVGSLADLMQVSLPVRNER